MPAPAPLVRRIIVWIGIWAAAAGIFVLQNISRYLVRGNAVDWFQAVTLEVLYWLPWVALTPVLLWAMRRFPLTGPRTRANALRHVAVMILFSIVQVAGSLALQYVAIVAVRPSTSGADPLLGAMFSVPGLIITGFWKYWVFVAVYSAFEAHRRLRERDVRAAQLETRLATAQLGALKAQLHPHFLFNTLHSVSMLNFVDADAANRVLVQLSDLLRLTLDRSVALELPLREEIDFLDRYLAIEQIRFDDRLEVQLEIDDTVLDAMVPNLILQPLVENALRHGIGPDSLATRLVIRARRDARLDGMLVLEVEDDGPGLPAGWSIRSGAGIGLSNVRDRLSAAYGERASLELIPAPAAARVLTSRSEGGTLTAAPARRGVVARVRIPYVAAARR